MISNLYDGHRQNHSSGDKIRQRETLSYQTMHKGRRPTYLHNPSEGCNSRSKELKVGYFFEVV